MFYYEQKTMFGKWSPVKSPTRPELKSGRLKCSDGLGPKVRGVKEIDNYLFHLTLEQLQAVYSPDGKFARSSRRLELS